MIDTDRPQLLATVPVKLNMTRGRAVRHRVEVLAYHVAGWARTRCLTHGNTDLVLRNAGDTLDKLAVKGARSCQHTRQIPGYRASDDQEIMPTPAVAGGHVATITPDGLRFRVQCPHGCQLGSSANAPSLTRADRRADLHKLATQPISEWPR